MPGTDVGPAVQPGRANRLLQAVFFWAVVRPIVVLGLGLNVRHRERLPAAGPAILVANHNSHLDTMVLMTLFPGRMLPRLRPVAAADYFLRGRCRAWFSRRVIGILPVERGGARRQAAEAPPTLSEPAPEVRDPLAVAAAALAQDDLVILFPEGTRGEPERMARFKSGVAHLARRFPTVPVVPVFLHGLGKSLPRGALVPIPFFCDVFVGEPLFGAGSDPHGLRERLEASLAALAAEGRFPPWE